MSLKNKIIVYLNRKPDFLEEVKLQDDGQGAYIKEWNISGVSKPSDSDLASYDAAATTAESNATVDATRRAAYGDIGDQLDEIYHDIDAWRTRIQGVKTANPKS